MDDEATQPATQIVIDPRRLGEGGSGLSDDDLADICCILSPASNPARRAASDIHKATPQYTINYENEGTIQEKNGSTQENNPHNELATQDIVQCDIAIRLSAKLKDHIGGFQFGRNKQRCDFVIGFNDPTRRISNIHFRIYINEYGIIMLEDQSTNGTAVDGVLLRGKEKENGKDYRHTIEQGFIVVLTMTPPEEDYRFVVRIPQRGHEAELAYNQNLTTFLSRVNNARAENEARARGGKEPINLFPSPGTATPNPTSMNSVGRSVKEWRGGPKYNKVGRIGKGAFAVVHKVTAKFDGVPFAAKELEKTRFMKNGVLDQKVDMEMKIMRSIQHPNIVKYIEHVDWENYLIIVMEYVPGGDLGSLINQSGRLNEANVNIMATQLLSALKYLHNKNITHRDVKPDNILIQSLNPIQIKLTDFGLSKMIDTEETFLRTFCGTLLYCAPEVYSEYREYDSSGRRNLRGLDKRSLPPQRYGHAVDIWSLGGVLFFGLCGSAPYPVKNGTSYQELLNQIMTQALDIRPLQLVNVSDSGIRFVRSMLHVRPEYRASIADLEQSSWITGDESIELSMEEDEVDMIDDGAGLDLEVGTSQLSIDQQIGNRAQGAEVRGEEDISGLTNIQHVEIPSSFSTNDDEFLGHESFGFIHQSQGNHNGRLFGELNVSEIGSSGVIPADHLRLPKPTARHLEPGGSTSMQSNDRLNMPENGAESASNMDLTDPDSTIPATMAPPPAPHLVVNSASDNDSNRHTNGSPSLLGAESMVGHLNMHSPASTTFPSADSPATTVEPREPTSSLRRPREEDDETHSAWRPSDMPAKRRRKSAREIDIPVPANIFWDPRDKSTHHYNYPKMSTFEFHHYSEYAESRGERFVSGAKTFEETMASFRSSRSPSYEPEAAARARSEPTNEGRHILMKRDERRLSDDQGSGPNTESRNANRSEDDLLPSTARPSNFTTSDSSVAINNHISRSATISQPLVGNDFHPPKRILAKIIATPESCLPTITFNLTETITSWGRGRNTNRYTNSQETRIPKYAFKIFLFKRGFYSGDGSSATSGSDWKETDQDMMFYISSKASSGIWINSTFLPSHDCQNPSAPSKHWGELRHGDNITVWYNTQKPTILTRVRFECFWGKSRFQRMEDEEFKLLEQGPLVDEMERICLAQENQILAIQDK